MTAHIDISALDDTELGAEVRAAFAEGRYVYFYDGRKALAVSRPGPKMMRQRCPGGHVWLSGIVGREGRKVPLQDVCPECGQAGEEH